VGLLKGDILSSPADTDFVDSVIASLICIRIVHVSNHGPGLFILPEVFLVYFITSKL